MDRRNDVSPVTNIHFSYSLVCVLQLEGAGTHMDGATSSQCQGKQTLWGRHAVTSFQHPTHRESMSRNYSLQRTTTVYFVFLSLCVRVWLPSNSRHKMEMSTFLHYLVLGSSRLGGALSTPQRTHPFSVQVLAQAVAPVLVLPSRPTPTSPTCR